MVLGMENNESSSDGTLPEDQDAEFASDKSSQTSIAETAEDEISSIATGVPPIPFHLVEKHHNKTTKLLSNSGTDEKIQAKNRWHDYEFSRPLFLCLIDIEGLNIADSDEYEFRVTLEGGKTKRFSKRPTAGKLRVDVNEFCTGISFKPPSVFWSIFSRTPELQKVSLWGFYKENLGEFLYKISRVHLIKNQAIEEIGSIKDATTAKLEELERKESELAGIDQNISDATASLTALNTSISEKDAADSELQSKIDRAESQLETVTEQVAERKTELQTATQSRENERLEVEKAKSELKRLKDDINLFPSEISGFVDQAGRDIETYIKFSAGLIAVICILFIWVLTGAFDLSEFIKQNPNRDVWPLLLAKLPLAIAVSALVAAAYKIARVFIEELLRINRQKLSLTQVSIIAKDVSQAAEHNLEFSETQTYGLRIRTKMALLSNHIGTFVPGEPHALLPQSIFDTLAEPEEDQRENYGDPVTVNLPEGYEIEGPEQGPDETKDGEQ